MENKLKHIAIIMDGNGRWAQQRELKRSFGHKKGANTLEKIMSGKCTSVDLMEIDLKVKNKMEKVGL